VIERSAIRSEVSEVNLQDLVRLVRSAPPGPIVEIGVYYGGSALRLYDVAVEQNRELHLFDTFSGMPVYSNGLDTFRIGSFTTDIGTPHRLQELMPEAKLHIGLYPETHPKDLADVAFIHCDCDQYISYLAVIDNMWPLVVEGGMMLFDDYPYLRGAKRAVDERFGQGALYRLTEHYYVVKAN
jgi:O-methyltransferase